MGDGLPALLRVSSTTGRRSAAPTAALKRPLVRDWRRKGAYPPPDGDLGPATVRELVSTAPLGASLPHRKRLPACAGSRGRWYLRRARRFVPPTPPHLAEFPGTAEAHQPPSALVACRARRCRSARAAQHRDLTRRRFAGVGIISTHWQASHRPRWNGGFGAMRHPSGSDPGR